MRFPRIK